jgi:hypothetical protein
LNADEEAFWPAGQIRFHLRPSVVEKFLVTFSFFSATYATL